MQVNIEPHPEGAVLKIRAHAGAKRSGVTGVHDGMLKVSVTQAPEKGKANKSLAAVIADWLDVRKSQLELLGGHTSTEKRWLVREISSQELGERVSAALKRIV